MKRIFLVIGSARAGGAEGQLVRLAVELTRRGLDVRVLFTTGDGPLTALLDEYKVPWEVLYQGSYPPIKVRSTVMMLVRLAGRLALRRPAVVFAWLPGAVWMALPLAMVLTRAVRIAAFRGDVSEAELTRYAPLFRRAVRQAHCVTVNAPSLRDEAIRWGADPDRVVFIPNGVDLPVGTSDVTVDPPTAVVVANFRPRKGHEVLVDALALVDQPVTVRLLGEGVQREPTRLRADRRGVTDRLRLVDHPADVARELAGAQFGIHPSHTEGLSNAILEQLASGLPVVATDVGGTGLLVEDGVNGFLVPAGDELLLAKRISELAASARLRTSMAAAARARAERFSWAACAERYQQLFSDVTTRCRGRR
jgi:glycosyltransferase involved in cell wall biosynthesis